MKTTIHACSAAALILCAAGFDEQKCSAVIGYVNETVAPGWTLLANPLKNTDDFISTVIPSPPSGSVAVLWDVSAQGYQIPDGYDPDFGWDTEISLPVGLGFAFYSPSNAVITFVGEVLQGSRTNSSGGLTNFVAGHNKFSLLGSKAPQTGPLTSLLEFPLIDGANLHLYNTPSQVFSNPVTCFQSYGWFDPNGVVGTGGPNLAVAQGFFVQNPGADTNWIHDFTPSASPNPLGSAELSIARIQITGGWVTLGIAKPPGTSCRVQFSEDRLNWSTFAANFTGTVWAGPLPSIHSGFFRALQP